jgi:hypothetical protein
MSEKCFRRVLALKDALSAATREIQESTHYAQDIACLQVQMLIIASRNLELGNQGERTMDNLPTRAFFFVDKAMKKEDKELNTKLGMFLHSRKEWRNVSELGKHRVAEVESAFREAGIVPTPALLVFLRHYQAEMKKTPAGCSQTRTTTMF